MTHTWIGKQQTNMAGSLLLVVVVEINCRSSSSSTQNSYRNTKKFKLYKGAKGSCSHKRQQQQNTVRPGGRISDAHRILEIKSDF